MIHFRRYMSQPCAIASCKRASRALCHCCNQNLCRDHLNEHDDVLNNRLTPFADEINQLNDQLNHLNVKKLIGNIYEQLEYWRTDAHQKIDRYYEEKRSKLDQFINTKISNQAQQMNVLRVKINELVEKKDTTMEDLISISSMIQSIRREITQIEYKSVDININQLEIDDKFIQIGDEYIKQDFNLSALMPPLHVINRSGDSSKPLASNGRVLLMHHEDQLCLLNYDMTARKPIPWTYGWIRDMCWSSTLSRFFLITLNAIFTLDENSMTLECLESKEKTSLYSCTCSDTSLYITTDGLGPSVCEFRLLPTIELINRWQPSDLCRADEIIQDMVFNKGTLAFIIENQTTHTKRMELRLAQTFDQVWSVQFDTVDPLHNVYRLCLFNYDEWMVIDWKSSQLYYITRDGQIKSTCTYDSVPYRCCQFGPNMLAMSTKNSVNFHKM